MEEKSTNRGQAKKWLLVVSCFALLVVILFGGIKYRTDYAKTQIKEEYSGDKQYILAIYMIGEPDWPFGATHCRFELRKGGKRITQYPFSIQNDGAMAHEGNFRIIWEKEKVSVVVSGEEQEDQTYVMYFNGDVE